MKITSLENKLEQVEEEHVVLQLKLVEREQELIKVKRLLTEIDTDSEIDLTDTSKKGHQSTTLIQGESQASGAELSLINGSVIPRRSHILVVGGARTQQNHLQGICKSFGIRAHQMKFELDFYAFNRINIKSLAYDSKIAGILIGPLPHKIKHI